jgi:hypothetical protein
MAAAMMTLALAHANTPSTMDGVVAVTAYDQGLPMTRGHLLNPCGWLPAPLALEVSKMPDVVDLDVHR